MLHFKLSALALYVTFFTGLSLTTLANANVTPQIAAGGGSNCVLSSTGAVQCWGLNTYGQLGNGTTTNAITPVVVSGLNLNLSSQTISFSALSNQAVNTSPFTVNATATSGLPVSFSSFTLSVCTVFGSTVTRVAVGTCIIAANQAGNTIYAAAPQVIQSFNIAAAGTTGTGSNVPVSLVDLVTGKQVSLVTFNSVTGAGTTSATTNVTAPTSPITSAQCTPPILVDVSTTATFTGSATVCVNPAIMGSTCGTGAALWHYTGGAWQQLATATHPISGDICGDTTSFSPFAVLAPATTTGNSGGDVPLPPWAYILLALGLMGAIWHQQRRA
jgi:hypothetical protein